MLQVSRAVQGVGGAIMFAVSLALLADAFRGKGPRGGVWHLGRDHRLAQLSRTQAEKSTVDLAACGLQCPQ
jgi:hypothetical protein